MSPWSEYRPTNTISRNLAEVERFQGSWQASDRLSPAIIDSLTQTTVVTSSGASTRIEGAILTDQEVAELMAGGCTITPLSSRSEREVSGYVGALRYIYDHRLDLQFSEKVIRELHQLLTEFLTPDTLPIKQRGAYKDVPNDVIEINEQTGERKTWFHTTPPGVATDTAMRRLIQDYAQATADDMQPLLKIGVFIVRFLAIHPFRDGNGRVSRLLTTLLLSQEYEWCQYVSHEKFIEDSKEHYYVALRQTQGTFADVPDYDPWLTFFTHTVARQARFLSKQILKPSVPAASSDLSANEKRVIALIAELGEPSLTDLQQRSTMSRDGLQKLMRRLRAKGVVELIGSGKSSRYRLSGVI